MRQEVRFAGFGGQGVVKSALLLTLAAGLYEGKEVAQTQSYGPEARGGACRSEVVISGQEIDFVKPMSIDFFAVMSQPAMDRYGSGLDLDKCVILADTTLVRRLPKEAARVYQVEATRLAEDELGASLFANIIMLGALAAVSGLVSLPALEKALPGNVPPQTLETNLKALHRGYKIGSGLIAA
ncbi:MAG: 2-oxoacid:acceptor oxidoreductase family protein [Desulfarculaceae bacterium]